ncbi:unnamed protein product [Ophioblennius macclurei]
MDSSGTLRALLLLPLLLLLVLGSVPSLGQTSQEVSVEDLRDLRDLVEQRPEPAADRELMEALETLLMKLHSPPLLHPDKRGVIPLCGMGDRCAMKYGPRIGKLCDCSRGANCNSYLLKCI